jgi:hypothetical protein
MDYMVLRENQCYYAARNSDGKWFSRYDTYRTGRKGIAIATSPLKDDLPAVSSIWSLSYVNK